VALTSDNAYAKALRAARVALPAHTVHTARASARAEEAARAAAAEAGFARRTQAGESPQDAFARTQGRPAPVRGPEADTGRVLDSRA
jgi:hypothetical protein